MFFPLFRLYPRSSPRFQNLYTSSHIPIRINNYNFPITVCSHFIADSFMHTQKLLKMARKHTFPLLEKINSLNEFDYSNHLNLTNARIYLI